MKNDINLFNDEMKKELAAYKKEERAVRRKEETYKLALADFKANNEERIEVINKIRLKKLAEINEQIRISQKELETLDKEWDNILHAYCEKHGHNFILTEITYQRKTCMYSPIEGYVYAYVLLYKCTKCGLISTHSTCEYMLRPEKYQQIIPEDAYDDKTLSKDGKTLRMIEQQEIPKLKEYINYLEYLKGKMCELFGHDAIINYDSETFKCKCCGKTMSHQEYFDAHYNAIYKGIVPFYYDVDINGSYIIPEGKKTNITLPNFEAYQRTLKKK